MLQPYDPSKIEPKWQQYWEELGLFKAEDNSKKEKFYCLDMFPYPSGDGLHVGHVEGYTATDIYSRYLRAKGYNVLHPFGWDAFGLPAENYAIKKKVHPDEATRENVDRFRKQAKSVGLSFDWSREVNTTDPKYYKWTQWIFLQIYKKGLAYEDTVPINWCPSCKTGLANEEVVKGECDRCHTAVEKKDMKQWILRITEYAERLLKDVDLLDWPEKIKEMQRNWIGKSEGYEVDFAIKNHEQKLKVFTTRIDTLYGATFMVLAPEHPFISEITTDSQKEKVEKYIEEARNKSDIERESIEKEKTGVFTGAYAINPANNQEVPIYIADYVMMNYGSGAIMAVPAHDERDFAFAKKYELEIVEVISPDGETHDLAEAFIGEGKLVNSGDHSGLDWQEAKDKIAEKLGAKKQVNYKLRDWIFSRQRYWGEPIPIIHCPSCGIVPVPEKDLPVKLPEVENYEPTGTGESPLAGIEDWVNTKCPECEGNAKRETNTMPQWAGSCWYYLRYIDPHNDEEIFAKKNMQYWCPVDLYVGGAEHAVLHLLYARFWHKVLYDCDYVDHAEPFVKLRNQGMILGEDGVKMSKSRGNVINPDDVVAEYGADTLRLYEMFMGPLEDDKPWDTKGIIGLRRFLERIWVVVNSAIDDRDKFEDISGKSKTIHKLIKEVSGDIDNFKFNTAISKLMIFFNGKDNKPDWRGKVSKAGEWDAQVIDWEALMKFLIALAPFAPHIAEELWERLGNSDSITKQPWPKFDEALVVEDTFQLVIQVNGKVRDKLEAVQEISEADAIALAKKSERIPKWLEGKKIVKEIYVPGRLVNIVAK
ncbi:leucine--tRNA ligase [Patescibacteria group bacterium]